MTEPLETTCEVCNGTGSVEYGMHFDSRSCKECHGTGIVPSESGRELLDFIQKHLPAMIQKAMRSQ